MEDKLLTIYESADQLRIGYATLNRYIKDGKIPIVMITKQKRFIRQSDLDKFVREHTGVYKQNE